MEYQRFVPEGWNQEKMNFSFQQLENIKNEGTIIQGFVNRCDEKSNLEIQLGDGIIGIIPRNEFDLINCDSYGLTKPNICKNKVNEFVQFKVKEIYNENRLLLSRKDAQKKVLNSMKSDLQPGMIVDRNYKKY